MMTDPVSAAVGATLLDTATGKVVGTGGWIIRKMSFSWRIAHRAQAAAAESGYGISLKQLRLITRQKVVKRALKQLQTDDVRMAKHLLDGVQITHTDGKRLSTDELFELLRSGYAGAAEQADRDLFIRDETKAGFESLSLTGGARQTLWRANLAKIPPPTAEDAVSLREIYGDVITKLVHEIVNSADRAETLRSWAAARPDWLPAEGRVLGWLGELSFDVDAPDAARTWFDAAVTSGAAPIEYWRVRRVMSMLDASPEERLAAVNDIAEHPLVVALSAPDFQVRLDGLRSWKTTSVMQEAMKTALTVDCLLSLLRFDEAIEIGVDAFDKNSFSGAGTNAAEAYIQRSGRQPGAHAADLSAGFALALRIRDARRQWGVSSGIAASKAVKAAVMLADVERAFELTRPPLATIEEAAHPEVRREAIVAMTLLDDVEGARKLLDDETPKWVRLQFESREAELLGDQERSNALLAEAIDAADIPGQKAGLCFRLVTKGVLHPFIETMRELNPETVADLELVAALVNGESGAEERARKIATERPTVALPLIEFFDEAGRRREVIAFAERAATKWADPDLWLKAARARYLEGEHAEAIDRAAKALDAGGGSWGRRASAYILQIEAAAAGGDWTTAETSAQALIRDQPQSHDARWALVRVRRNSGELDQAYEAWKAVADLAPRNAEEAAVWLELFRLRGSEMATLQGFFDVATRFAPNLQIRKLALGALLSARITEEVGELNFGTLLAQFERDYPGDHGIRKIELGENAEGPEILAAIQAEIGPPDDSRKPLLDGAASGTLPVGFIAGHTGRQVAELLNVLFRSPRFAGSVTANDGSEAVVDALKRGAVVDVTALFTMTLLKPQHSELLEAKFSRLVSTSEQMLDATGAREAFNRDPGGMFFAGTAEERPSFRPNDPIEHEVQRQNGARLVEWFRRTDHQAGRPIRSDIAKRLSGDNDVWLTAADLAARSGLPLWCDDAATRAIAEEAGAKTFGTPGLIEYLRDHELITQAVADELDADLVHNFTLGVAYRAAVFDLVAQTDQMAPHGLAVAIRHGGPDHAAEKVKFITRAMGAVVSLPDQLADWAAVAFRYLRDVTDQPQMAHDNRVKFLHGLLIQPWMTPSALVFVVSAGRVEADEGWAEVFRDGFGRMFALVAQQTDHATAAKFGHALVSELEDSERHIALSIILAR